MIYYCSDCEYAEEIDNKDIASGKIQLSEICPKCNSVNVSLREDSSTNIGKAVAWWLLVAPCITMAITIIPLGLALTFENKNDFLYNLLMSVSIIVYLVSYIYAGLAPKIYKKKKITDKYIQAKQALESNDYKVAEQNFSDILNINPRETEIYLERGKIRLLSNQLPLATNDFTTATLLQPNNVECAYYRATIFMHYMDDEACNIAIERFSALILSGYVKGECFNDRGKCYLELGYFDKALADFEKAIKLEPTNQEYKENKQLVLSKMSGRNQNVSFQTVDEIYPANDSNVVVNLDNCTKEDLLRLNVFNEEQANKFIADRESGKYYYDVHSLGQGLNLQPHEILELENKLIFPLKQSFKTGRTIDF